MWVGHLILAGLPGKLEMPRRHPRGMTSGRPSYSYLGLKIKLVSNEQIENLRIDVNIQR